MITAIVGSRGFDDYTSMCQVLSALTPQVTMVVSGGAKGADTLAERWAYANSIPCKVLRPDWSKGRGAGHIRNSDIVRMSERVVAFWDGVSPGTKSTIDMARRSNKEVIFHF
jgi:hypothetical protein